MSDYKECPFCGCNKIEHGEETILVKVAGTEQQLSHLYVECHCCRAKKTAPVGEEEYLRDAWNKRFVPQGIKDFGERLNNELRLFLWYEQDVSRKQVFNHFEALANALVGQIDYWCTSGVAKSKNKQIAKGEEQ